MLAAVSGEGQGVVERRFMWTVQALAMSAEVQLGLFPDFAEAADELALDHDEAQREFLEARGAALSEAQRVAAKTLDDELVRMSGPPNEALWTEAGLREAPEWVRVRALAAELLAAMGWPCEAPPRDRAVYVGPPGS